MSVIRLIVVYCKVAAGPLLLFNSSTFSSMVPAFPNDCSSRILYSIFESGSLGSEDDTPWFLFISLFNIVDFQTELSGTEHYFNCCEASVHFGDQQFTT